MPGNYGGGKDPFAGGGGGGGGGGSRSSGRYGGGRDPFAGGGGRGGGGKRGKQKKHGGGGFLGTLGHVADVVTHPLIHNPVSETVGEAATNLGYGAERAVLGFPAFVVGTTSTVGHDVGKVAATLAGHPGGWRGPAQEGATRLRRDPYQTKTVILDPIAKQYAWKYGPLFTEGDIRTTARRALVKDPFGTLLDAATVYGAAENLATRLGLGGGLRELPLRGPEALARAGKTLKKTDLTVIVPSSVPGPRPGYVRLYRGEGPIPAVDLSDPVARANAALNRDPTAGRWFTDKPEYAARYPRTSPSGGQIKYVDVPETDLAKYHWGRNAPALRVEGNEYLLPEELAGQARALPSEASQPPVIGGRAVRGPALLTRAAYAAMRLLPAETPVIGELAAYNRALARLPENAAAARRLWSAPLSRAMRKLTRNQRAAVALLGRWPLPRLLDAKIAEWRALEATGVEVPALKIATDPKIRKFYDRPDPKMLVTIEEARKLGVRDAELLAQYGQLTPEVAAASPYLHMRLASGGKFEPRPLAPEEISVGTWVKPSDRLNIGRITEVNGDRATVHFFNRQTGLEENVDFAINQLNHPSETELVGGNTIEDLAAETATAGRPQPVYLHDTAVGTKAQTGPAFEPTGGGTSPIPRSPVHRNEGHLAAIGQLLLDPTTLMEQHFANVKYALYRDIHASLEDIAMRVPQGSKLPNGYQYLRRVVRGPEGGKKAEQIGYAERTAGEHAQWVEDLLGTDEKAGELGKHLTTISEEDALTLANGDRLVVPTSTVRRMAGEFQRSGWAIRWFVEKPLDVWRWLLLNWSPRWLTNNIVGNTIMALMRFGGPTFIRHWLDAVRRHSGPASIERLFKDQQTARALTDDELAAIAPQLFSGTFKAQNMPFQTARAGGKFRAFMREGLSPIDRGYEQRLRAAAFRTQVEKSPEAQAVYKQMPKQTRNWRAATKKALEDNPALLKKIMQEVDSGLGSFTGLSPVERNWIRRFAPFYAWYRAIIRVTLGLPFEVPIRTRLVAQLSQLQQEEQDLMNPDLPQQLRGSIPIGQGGAFLTQGMNPYATVPQVARGLGFAAAGGDWRGSQAAFGLLNPGLQQLPNVPPGYGTRSPGFLWTLLSGTYGNLPPIQALNLLSGRVPQTKTYEPLPYDYWMSLAGLPIRHPQEPIRR